MVSPRTDVPGQRRARAAAARGLVVVLLISTALAGCATTAGRRGTGRPFVAEGRASYYARHFDGRPTASGERYDPERMTAAHATLPFGTWLRVTRTDGRFVDVRVNDRCGCGGGHVVDLSRAAARRLDMIRAGTVQVRLEVIEK
jgi:rare lipoprotein A